MTDKKHATAEIGRAESRWARVGPYYAMFPMNYVEGIIREYSNPGDAVLDPFAGRFSVPAVASYMGRVGCGIEINPLGWLYGKVKLAPAQRRGDVLNRLQDMHDASEDYKSEAAGMDGFFRMCYCTDVLRFLLACRNLLNWEKSVVDATLMAAIMVVLHHGVGRGLSNQMRQPKAMAPHYSVNWWKSRGMEEPPQVDVVKFLSDRINYRYERGVFRYDKSKALLGDSCTILASAKMEKWQKTTHGGVKLLFTSPPYWSLVNYFKDQWLRLWMLGGNPSPAVRSHAYQKGFYSKDEYRHLIETVFERCAQMMRKDGVVVVRMDARSFTRQTVLDALHKSFPGHKKARRIAVTKGQTQTRLFNNVNSENVGERDIVLVPA